MSLKLLQTIAAAFTRASSAYKKNGSLVTNGNPRYENVAQSVVVDKKRLWDAGTHSGTISSGNILTTSSSSSGFWTSPWYDSTVSGCIWSDFGGVIQGGGSGYMEFRASNTIGSGAWGSLPATGQYVQARVTMNPLGQSDYPYLDSFAININSVDYGKGIMIEEATTNLFAAPAAPASENVTVTANGDYTLSIYGDDTSSGSVVITHEKFEDTQSDFNTGTLVGVTALSSGAIALDVQADPTFTRATVATKKDFSQVTSGNARFEELVTPFTLDLQHQFDAGTKEGVTTSSGAVSVDFTPTFTRASTATNKKFEVIPSGQIRYDDLVAPITVDTQFDWENSGTKDSTLTTASSGDLTMINGTPTFTRATVAYKKDGTQVASGVARYEKGKNLLAYSEDFTAWSIAAATVTANNTLAPDGNMTADKITSTGSNGYVNLLTTALPSTTYTFSVWLKSDVTTNLRMLAYDGSTYGPTTDITVTTEWQRFSYTRTTGTSATSLRNYIGGDSLFSTGESVYAWGAQLELGSSATTYSKGGESAIMIEEGTTNKLDANAHTFVNGVGNWTTFSGSSVTVTSGQIDHMGGTNAYRIQTTGGTHVLKYNNNGYTPSSGTVVSISIWIKNNNVADVTVFSNEGGRSQTVTQAQGWTRVKLEGIIATGVGSAQIQFRVPSVGDNVDVYVLQPQIEEKAYATSWQVGGTARNAETLTIPGSALNHNKGAVIIKAFVGGDLTKTTPSSEHHLFELIDTATLRNQIAIYLHTTGRWYAQSANNTTFSSANWLSTLSEGWHTFGIRWDSTELSLWIDGTKRASTATPNIPSILGTNAYIGSRYNGTYQWDNPIDEVNIFHEALSDSDMATLTQI